MNEIARRSREKLTALRASGKMAEVPLRCEATSSTAQTADKSLGNENLAWDLGVYFSVVIVFKRFRPSQQAARYCASGDAAQEDISFLQRTAGFTLCRGTRATPTQSLRLRC